MRAIEDRIGLGLSDFDHLRLKREIHELMLSLLLYQLVQMGTVFLFHFLLTLLQALGEKMGGSFGGFASEIPGGTSFTAISSMVGFTLGFLVLQRRMRGRVCARDIFEGGRRMSLSTFLQLFVLFMCGQAVFTLSATILEKLFNGLGYSLEESVKQATSVDSSLAMWIYVGFFAPLLEELVFRGFVLRRIRSYGKRFAILFSAMIFGVMHANLPQSIFAFYIGLVLGYIAVTYSIGYTILFHFLNNFVFGCLLDFLISETGFFGAAEVWYVLDLVFVILGLCVLFCKRRAVAHVCFEHHSPEGIWRTVFCSPTVVLFLLLEGMLALSLMKKI